MASNPVTESTKHATARGWVIIVGFILSVVLAAINWLQLGSLERALGGVAVPETQLFGYDVGYVEVVRTLMTDELLERYGAAHYLWDVLFSLAFALTLILLARRIARGRKILWLLMVVPVLYAAVNIGENFALEALMGSDTITSQAVMLASTFTVLKTVLFVLSLATALLTLGTRPRR
ncbi:hypothetical protein [Arthrobacter sp. AET 35A]|uniref:hypothetical protein n=1 Tax=Arthrobacter sp. AET 35A TaxID=2292643 RepID=UPI001786879E|nr:hypothetical protein [Arthrobacter sp. AET 35A]